MTQRPGRASDEASIEAGLVQARDVSMKLTSQVEAPIDAEQAEANALWASLRVEVT